MTPNDRASNDTHLNQRRQSVDDSAGLTRSLLHQESKLQCFNRERSRLDLVFERSVRFHERLVAKRFKRNNVLLLPFIRSGPDALPNAFRYSGLHPRRDVA